MLIRLNDLTQKAMERHEEPIVSLLINDGTSDFPFDDWFQKHLGTFELLRTSTIKPARQPIGLTTMVKTISLYKSYLFYTDFPVCNVIGMI